LILHKKILTWENLVKRGMYGPSRCHLCEVQEETTDHLLDGCSYTTEVWDWVAIVYRQTDRVKGDIRETLGNWREHYNENEMVNLCWGLTLGWSFGKFGRKEIGESSRMNPSLSPRWWILSKPS
jgi:hypothetical protein